MVNQRELTEEGFEKNFATNTLGTKIYCIFIWNNAKIYIGTRNILTNQYIIILCLITHKSHKFVVIFRHLHPHQGFDTCIKEG